MGWLRKSLYLGIGLLCLSCGDGDKPSQLEKALKETPVVEKQILPVTTPPSAKTLVPVELRVEKPKEIQHYKVRNGETDRYPIVDSSIPNSSWEGGGIDWVPLFENVQVTTTEELTTIVRSNHDLAPEWVTSTRQYTQNGIEVTVHNYEFQKREDGRIVARQDIHMKRRFTNDNERDRIKADMTAIYEQESFKRLGDSGLEEAPYEYVVHTRITTTEPKKKQIGKKLIRRAGTFTIHAKKTRDGIEVLMPKENYSGYAGYALDVIDVGSGKRLSRRYSLGDDKIVIKESLDSDKIYKFVLSRVKKDENDKFLLIRTQSATGDLKIDAREPADGQSSLPSGDNSSGNDDKDRNGVPENLYAAFLGTIGLARKRKRRRGIIHPDDIKYRREKYDAKGVAYHRFFDAFQAKENIVDYFRKASEIYQRILPSLTRRNLNPTGIVSLIESANIGNTSWVNKDIAFAVLSDGEHWSKRGTVEGRRPSIVAISTYVQSLDIHDREGKVYKEYLTEAKNLAKERVRYRHERDFVKAMSSEYGWIADLSSKELGQVLNAGYKQLRKEQHETIKPKADNLLMAA